MKSSQRRIALILLILVGFACAPRAVKRQVTGPVPTRQQTFFAHYQQSLTLAHFTYETTFRAIGDASRAGIITPADVEELNVIGRIVQRAGQEVTAALAAYLKITDPGASEEAKIQAALSVIEKAVADVVALATKKGVEF